MPHKDKMEKIPWESFKDYLNVPEEILQKLTKGMEKELQQARERYEEDSFSDSEVEDIAERRIYE